MKIIIKQASILFMSVLMAASVLSCFSDEKKDTETPYHEKYAFIVLLNDSTSTAITSSSVTVTGYGTLTMGSVSVDHFSERWFSSAITVTAYSVTAGTTYSATTTYNIPLGQVLFLYYEDSGLSVTVEDATTVIGWGLDLSPSKTAKSMESNQFSFEIKAVEETIDE